MPNPTKLVLNRKKSSNDLFSLR